MQIDDDAAIESKRAEKSVLHLQVARFQSAAKSRESEHDGGESERRPIVREKSPGGGCGGERAEIGMGGQQGTIGGIIKKIFPARADSEGIEVEDNGAEGEQDSGGENWILIHETQVEEMTEVNAGKMHADEQACQETKAAEYDFFGDDSGCQESLRAHKPEDGHVVSGIVERNGSQHQRRADHA